MQKIKQSSATRHILFLMVDSTDHVTGKTGLTPTVTISKNAAAFASPAGAVTEVSSGWYKLAANATDSNTLGILALHATGTAADPTDLIVADIVAYDPDDTVRLGLTALPNAAAAAAGGLFTRGTGAGQINQAANGQVDVNVVNNAGTAITAAAGIQEVKVASIANNALTAAAINADAITAAKVAADVSTEIRDKIIERTCLRGTVSTASSTTSVTTSAMSPATTAADQVKGRIVIFDHDTTTAALRGQATDITASTASATPTLTVTALTTAPASGDTFTIV